MNTPLSDQERYLDKLEEKHLELEQRMIIHRYYVDWTKMPARFVKRLGSGVDLQNLGHINHRENI